MPTPPQPPQPPQPSQHPSERPSENTYILDSQSAAEMSRLMDQDHLLTQGMGGLFPNEFDFTNTQRILDIACGPGGWALEMAFAHADVEVIGIDISEKMISYANTQARIQGLSNASFRLMNALEPLDFPAASFDIINARFLVGFMPRTAWPTLLQQCMRLLRPGGTLRFTELDEPGTTNSLAFEYWKQLTFRAVQQAGMTASPDGRTFGIMALLPRLFRDAGFEQLQYQGHIIDFSAGTPSFESMYQNCVVAFQLVQPFLRKMKVAPEEELNRCYQQMLLEMVDPDFCAIWYYLSVMARKPRE